MFVLNGDKPACWMLVRAVATPKESNLQWHIDTKHRAEYAILSHREKKRPELKGSLSYQQHMLATVTAKNDAAVRGSVVVTEENARPSKCSSEGVLLKQCLLKVYEKGVTMSACQGVN